MTKYERGEAILIIVLESVLVIAKNWKKLRSVLSKKVKKIKTDYNKYLQPIITQYFIDNKSEIWLLFLIAHSKR